MLINELLNRDDLLDHISDAAEIPTSPRASRASLNRYRGEDGLARCHFVFNLSNEAKTNVTGVFLENASAKITWNRLKWTCQEDNVQAISNRQGHLFKFMFSKG